MAKNNQQAAKRRSLRQRKQATRVAKQILREWRGCAEPLDLNQGIHQPQDFLNQILHSAGVETGIHEEKLRSVWKDIAGDFIASHTEPVSVKKNELLLRVSQPTLRFQLERMKPELLGRIHHHFGNQIKTIRFTHG